MTSSGRSEAAEDPDEVPDAASLAALDADGWAEVLPLLRAALHDVADDVASPAVRRLRATPPGRLASGRLRAELCALVEDDPRVRAAVASRLSAETRDEILRGPSRRADAGGRGVGRRADGEAAARAERDRARLREAREERDRARRRLDGAEARAVAAEREAARLRERTGWLEGELEDARAALAGAREDRRRAVERERRRSQGRLAELREEVRALRRRASELERRGPDGSTSERPREAGASPAPPPSEPVPRVLPGRPTRLPEDVAPQTAEAVDLMLGPGRLVIIDGYNVTLTHRGQLDLAGQRDWLVRRLATLAARRRVRPLVVFDGERASGTRPPAGAREVEVRFTAPGITADDELLFVVEALPPDDPVLAVTDDRELTARLADRGADVVGTGPFLWAT